MIAGWKCCRKCNPELEEGEEGETTVGKVDPFKDASCPPHEEEDADLEGGCQNTGFEPDADKGTPPPSYHSVH